MALLGVPGEWPLDGRLGLDGQLGLAALDTVAEPVPEPGSLALSLGAAGLAGARALGRRRPAGRDPSRFLP